MGRWYDSWLNGSLKAHFGSNGPVTGSADVNDQDCYDIADRGSLLSSG